MLFVSDNVEVRVLDEDAVVDVSEVVSDIKYRPQYIETIDVIRDRFSKSFNAIVPNGFFFELTCRNLNIINDNKLT